MGFRFRRDSQPVEHRRKKKKDQGDQHHQDDGIYDQHDQDEDPLPQVFIRRNDFISHGKDYSARSGVDSCATILGIRPIEFVPDFGFQLKFHIGLDRIRIYKNIVYWYYRKKKKGNQIYSVPFMNHKPYGLELILDLKGCDLSDLSREKLADYFIRLCDLIRMQRHGDPVFWEDQSGIPHLHGISAVQFIETSNLVCHALPRLKAVYLNLFSCKEFDTEAAKRFSTEFWGAESVVFTVVTRT